MVGWWGAKSFYFQQSPGRAHAAGSGTTLEEPNLGSFRAVSMETDKCLNKKILLRPAWLSGLDVVVQSKRLWV